MGCTLAPPGGYDWTVRVWRRCGLMSNYFDHLLLYPASFLQYDTTISYYIYVSRKANCQPAYSTVQNEKTEESNEKKLKTRKSSSEETVQVIVRGVRGVCQEESVWWKHLWNWRALSQGWKSDELWMKMRRDRDRESSIWTTRLTQKHNPLTLQVVACFSQCHADVLPSFILSPNDHLWVEMRRDRDRESSMIVDWIIWRENEGRKDICTGQKYNDLPYYIGRP